MTVQDSTGRTRSRTAAFAAGTAISLGLVSLCAARVLPPIDRLADAPPRPATNIHAGGQAPDPAVSMHSRLGVPAFAWAQRGGPVADLARNARAAAGTDPVVAARGYLRALGALYDLPADQAARVPALYAQALPNGAALVKFRNRIAGIEVFREESGVLLGPDRSLVAIGGFVMGGDGSAAFRTSPESAAAVALSDWSFGAGTEAQLSLKETRDGYRYFDLPAGTTAADGSRLDSPVRVKPVWFRLPGVLRPAWYVEVQVLDMGQRGQLDGYAYVIAADDGSVLFRNSLQAEASFNYRMFAESTGNNLPLPSPLGRNGFPHPTGTPNGYVGAFVTQNLIGLQNLAFSHNDPWLAPAATVTTGNNVDAFADLVAPDDYSPGDLRAGTSAAGTFDYAHDPAQQPGANSTQIQASVVNLFYMNNYLHDWYYDAGFDEAAGNAQADNFGRGGAGGDPIFAEAQDYSGFDNANMNTPADGGRPRMRMYIFGGLKSLQTIINTPAAIAGSKQNVGAAFGPQTFNIGSVDVAAAIPAAEKGCGPTPVTGVGGKIALIDRGNCTYKTKVTNAQAAGAVGVIVVNNTTGLPTGMGDDPTIVTDPAIPATLITQADGTAIKNQLAIPVAVNATLLSAQDLDRDGTIDNTVVAHEWAHYLTNRLVGNASGLNTNQSQGMGEGWSDFNALLLLVKGTDSALPNNANFSGTYAAGGYVSSAMAFPNDGLYYGIRRYPYSRDMTKNPLTFKYITNGVALPASPPPQFGTDGLANSEVHNTGEVWSSMLWECYSNLLNDTGRLTFAQAQDRMKRYLVAGLKLTPVAPTFVEARDALLAAMLSQDTADYADCLTGFAKRGLGIGAVAPDRYSTDNSGVAESFVQGGAIAVVSTTLADTGYCIPDGYLDNGEHGTVTVTLQNIGTTPLSATTGSVTSSNPHVTFPSGNALVIPPSAIGQSMALMLPVQMAGGTGVETTTLTVTVDDPGLSTPRPVVAAQTWWVNVDVKLAQSATDTIEPAASAWTAGSSLPSPAGNQLWQRIAVSEADHRLLGPDIDAPGLTWLQSPPLNVAASGSFSFSFKHRFGFEYDSQNNYDGGAIQLSSDGGATWTDIGAFATPGYNGTISLVQGDSNPMAGQAGYVKTNAAWPARETVAVNLGTAYAGQTVRIRFVVATDDFGTAPGWEIDDIAFANITNTPFAALVPHAAACFTIAVQAGSPQWVAPSGTFAMALKALVRDGSGTPVAGVPVTFAAPASGPSANFSGSASVVTDGTGVATAPALVANATTGSYEVTAVAGLQAANFALANLANPPTLDIDGNTQYDALTDGLLVLRYLFGLSGPTLTNGAIGSGASRATATAVAQYAGGIQAVLDVDGNGVPDALTDGLMVIRYLFGLRGATLINGAIGPGATRSTAPAIEAYIQSLMP